MMRKLTRRHLDNGRDGGNHALLLRMLSSTAKVILFHDADAAMRRLMPKTSMTMITKQVCSALPCLYNLPFGAEYADDCAGGVVWLGRTKPNTGPLGSMAADFPAMPDCSRRWQLLRRGYYNEEG